MEWLQARYKAVVALVLGFLGPLWAFWQQNQSLTLKQALGALVAGLVTGGATHQVPNKKGK